MKRTYINLVMLLVLSGFFAMQSCKKEDTVNIVTMHTFTVPVATAPVDASTTDLTWSATGGATIKWDVYFSEDESPALLQKDYTSQKISVTVKEGHTYYWKVVNVDANGIKTTSPIFSFDVAISPVPFDINNFVGAYNVDEGGYLYKVNLTKVNANTLQSDNFWDNAPSPLWVIQYVFDNYGHVTITPSTYRTSATSSTIYGVTGSGTFDNATGALTIDYVVKKNVYTLKNDGTYSVVTTTADSGTDKMTK